jgi:rubrerythrin
MDFENLAAVLDFAIEKEVEAAAFYTHISQEETFSGAGKMFEEFAEEERKHQQLLEDFKARGHSAGIEDYQFKWITDIKRSNYVVDLEYRRGMGYSDILMLAMKREEKALQLYDDFLDKAESEESRTLFKMLCQEEAKHKLALETMYDDYMAEMGD